MRALISLVVIFTCVTIFDVILGILSAKIKNILGKSLCVCCLGSAVVTGSYLASVFVENYFAYSVLSSIYFGGIDVTLFALLIFVRHFTKRDRNDTVPRTKAWYIITGYTIFDFIVLAINPFFEISIHYIYEPGAFPHYGYETFPLYQMHLLLSYIYIFVVLLNLLKRAGKVPSVYRRQYLNAVWTIILVVAINVIYLYYQTSSVRTAIDYSLLGYSLAAGLFYWNCFIYSTDDMLNRLRNHIFSNLDQGIILFDYKDELILENEKATEMFASAPWKKTMSPYELFSSLTGYPGSNAAGDGGIDKKLSFQCYPDVSLHLRPMRCDYSPLLSGRGEVLGRMFVFSNLSQEFDALTGFMDWEAYKRSDGMVKRDEDSPDETFVACDLNGLAEINRLLGHDKGDRAIQTLAQRMRENFPAGTVFIRGREAILVAVSRNLDKSSAEKILCDMEGALSKDVFGETALSIQSAIHVRRVNESAVDAADSTMNMLRTRKLLDEKSRHSSVLYSLMQALKECDKDTEAHVRRTQKLARDLGKRLSLTEEQQSNLSLLAMLHDIGKIGIPLDILNKPGRLTDAEWEVIKSHVEKGYQITSNTKELRGIAEMVLYHHERWDGKGYPDGLSKETIPLLSRIIAVVDAYDAMINDRSYRRAMPKEQAVRELRRCAGTQFDPAIVSEFLNLLQEDYGETFSKVTPLASEKSGAPAGATVQWSQETPESLEDIASRVHSMHYSRYITDEEQHIIEVDDAFTDLTGYTRGDVAKGLLQEDLIFDEDLEEYRDIVKSQVDENSSAWLEHRIRRKDGSPLFVYCYGRRYYDSAQRTNRTEITITDSTATNSVQTVIRMEQNKALRRLERWENKYRRDPLTGLLNHEAFKNDIEARLLTENHQAMMLMMDVDLFKEYNDTYGHRAGDEFLIMVAQAILGTLRDNDFACRMGGDEFAAILFFPIDVERSRMKARAEEICEKINLLLTSMEKGGTSLSAGGAFYGEDVNTFDKLYEAADKALYRAKEKRSHEVMF